MLHERDIPFRYEQPLYASDGTLFLPDFTITWRGSDFFWEHVGMLHHDDYTRTLGEEACLVREVFSWQANCY